MFKLAFLILVVVYATAYQITITNPWAESVWKAGQQATVSFNIEGNESKPVIVTVDLMSGDPNDGLHLDNIATNVNLSNQKNCSWKVPDYPTNTDYFVRVGNGESWVFSHYFQLIGTGKQPLPQKSTSQGTVVYKDNKVKSENTTTTTSSTPNRSAKSSDSNTFKLNFLLASLVFGFTSLL